MRSAIAHFVFLLAAAALASYVWIDRWTPRGDLPVLLDAGIDDLVSAKYHWPNGDTQVLREGEGKGRVYVVTVSRTYDPAAEARVSQALNSPDNRLKFKTGSATPESVEKAARAAAPPGPLATESKTFPPGLFPIASIQKLTPLRARRALEVSEGELAGMGLAPAQRSLELDAGSRELALDIGNETFGGQAFYARSRKDGSVYLLDAELIRTLETTPAAMMDPRIVAVPLSDVTGLELEIDGKKSSYIQKNKDQFRARYFARAETPEKKSEAVDNLNSSFVALKAPEFLASAPEGQVLCTIRFLREDAPPHEVRIQQNADGSYTIFSGRWIAALPEADARKILEEVRAAL